MNYKVHLDGYNLIPAFKGEADWPRHEFLYWTDDGSAAALRYNTLNKTVYKSLRNYLEQVQPADEDYVFASRKGNSHIQSQAVSKLVKKWTRAINLRGNYGCHTLRKTWGYQQRVAHGVGFEIICKRYSHSSPAITMRYLGIEDREVHDVLMNEIG